MKTDYITLGAVVLVTAMTINILKDTSVDCIAVAERVSLYAKIRKAEGGSKRLAHLQQESIDLETSKHESRMASYIYDNVSGDYGDAYWRCKQIEAGNR
jgi:hypothetical protein